MTGLSRVSSSLLRASVFSLWQTSSQATSPRQGFPSCMRPPLTQVTGSLPHVPAPLGTPPSRGHPLRGWWKAAGRRPGGSPPKRVTPQSRSGDAGRSTPRVLSMVRMLVPASETVN